MCGLVGLEIEQGGLGAGAEAERWSEAESGSRRFLSESFGLERDSTDR